MGTVVNSIQDAELWPFRPEDEAWFGAKPVTGPDEYDDSLVVDFETGIIMDKPRSYAGFAAGAVVGLLAFFFIAMGAAAQTTPGVLRSERDALYLALDRMPVPAASREAKAILKGKSRESGCALVCKAATALESRNFSSLPPDFNPKLVAAAMGGNSRTATPVASRFQVKPRKVASLNFLPGSFPKDRSAQSSATQATASKKAIRRLVDRIDQIDAQSEFYKSDPIFADQLEQSEQELRRLSEALQALRLGIRVEINTESAQDQFPATRVDTMDSRADGGEKLPKEDFEERTGFPENLEYRTVRGRAPPII